MPEFIPPEQWAGRSVRAVLRTVDYGLVVSFADGTYGRVKAEYVGEKDDVLGHELAETADRPFPWQDHLTGAEAEGLGFIPAGSADAFDYLQRERRLAEPLIPPTPAQ